MITKVSDLTKKSFKNYTGPDTGSEFKKKNLIFGYNGRGKTSLALGIIDEFLNDKTKLLENYRLFNRKYVVENLLLENGGGSKIKGVVANFGKSDVDAEKKIEELENEIKDTKLLSDEIDTLRTDTRKEIDNIHNQRKGDSYIQIKPNNKTVEEVVKFYQDDVIKAKKIEKSEDELLKIRGDNSFEVQKQKIVSLNIGNISSITDGELDEIAEVFDKTFDDKIPTTKIIEWLNTGLEFHQEGDECKFCGGALAYQSLKSKIEIYNANERQKSVKKLVDFKEEVDEIINQIQSLIKNKNSIIANLESEEIAEILTEIQKNEQIISKNIAAIQGKITDTSITSGFDNFGLKQALITVSEKHKIIAKIKSDEITKLDKKINNQATLVKGAIGVEISKNILIKKNLKEIPEKEKELKDTENKNTKYRSDITKLKNSKSTTKDFADHISLVLQNIGVNLKLDLFEDDYIIKHTSSNDTLTIDDISEGEQNLLALLFFYYELFTDKEQKEFKTSIELIVIDDPISSVDDVNRMYVFELIKNLLEIDVSQIFVFTHIWEDFCNLCYGRKDKEETPYRFFEIKKDSSGSKIVRTKTNESPYRHHFKEIYEFSRKQNCDDLSKCEIYHYPNVMRKVLEEFLSFKVKNNSPTRDNKNNIERVLLVDNQTNDNKTKVSALLDTCNLLSHKASRNPDEILKSAQFLIARIKNVDKQHFDSMIGE